jgi:hypothetical protein
MINRLLKWLRRSKREQPDTTKLVEGVLLKLTQTDENEISCDEVHELIDQFAELEIAGADVQHLMPLVQKHLDLCPDCLEEHDVLVDALAYEESIADEL